MNHSKSDRASNARLSRFLQRLGGPGNSQVTALAAIDLIFAAFLALSTPIFLTSANLLAVGVAMSGSALAAMGSTLVLLTGGFDLSVGSNYGLAGVVATLMMRSGTPVLLALLLGLLTGSLFGLINGLLVAKVQINPFIATMGTMTIGRGIINILTKGYSISGLPDSFMQLVHARVLGLPPSFVAMIVVVLATDLLLRFWRPARQIYYVGGSPAYARLIGVRVDLVRIIAYVLSGTLAAMGGLLFAMRTGAGSQQAGIGLELTALVAPFLGGVGFGGVGTALGAFLGALLIGLVFNAVQLLGVAVLWQDIIIGVFLIVAALVGMMRVQRIFSGRGRAVRQKGG